MCLHDTTQQGVWRGLWRAAPSSAFSRVRSPHFTFPVLQEAVPCLSSCDLKASLFLCRMVKMWARSLSVLLYTYIYKKYVCCFKPYVKGLIPGWRVCALEYPVLCFSVETAKQGPFGTSYLLPETLVHLVPISHWQPHEPKLAIWDWSLGTIPVLPPLLPQFSAFFFNVLRTNKATSHPPWVSEPLSHQVLCQTEMLMRKHSD